MSRLPDFVIIGASRSGTSSLFRSLLQHPELSGPKTLGNDKEVHFFDRKYERGIQYYKGLFNGKRFNFEATPNYIFDSRCPERIARDLPRCKFITMFRNPVERAFSHYRNWKQKNSWTEKTIMNRDHLVIQKGLYFEQLKRWHEHIDKSRLMIIRSEDFYGNPEKIIHDVLDFVGLPVMDLKMRYWDPKNKKQAKPDKHNQVMSNGLRTWLKRFYKPHNEKLYEYLGRDMGWI